MRQTLRTLFAVVVLVSYAACPMFLMGGGSKGSSGSKTKSVYVHGYQRKNGTYVGPYYRSAPGTSSDSGGSGASAPVRYTHPDYMAPGYHAHSTVTLDSHGKIRRSKAARSAFMRAHPCPSTGKASGSCPGYVVDHVQALACGGADDPSNMQWQTVAEGKAKDKVELWCK